MRLLPIRVKYFKPGETVAVLYLHQGSNKKNQKYAKELWKR